MEVFIARQPIFDKCLNVYGYELLYRQSKQNFFPGIDDNQATAELLINSVLVMGLKDITDGTLAFINFSKDLIGSSVPYLLPRKDVVIEVLERDAVTPATVEACKKLHDMGYTIALDDFVFSNDLIPLIELADIIKVEYPAVSLSEQRALIRSHGSKKRFLAEKIETREDFKIASKLGYHFFQGYFFSKPVVVNAKEICVLNTNIFSILEELHNAEPSYQVISNIIERDLGLSLKLLNLANSVYYGAVNQIKTIRHALAYIGMEELYQWLSLMMLKDIQNVENAEMVKLSMIRGKVMELSAKALGLRDESVSYFFTGIFSFLDVLLNKPMVQVVTGLPLLDQVKQALVGEDNDYRRLLNCVIACESGEYDKVADQYPMNKIGLNTYADLYLDALKWTRRLNY
ncbi:MAG: HDOD domain-containing protein [Candidatus Pelethousia sp.]|nr:HDOD domain-containing protein [Candidatus Pelethousia sp.]